MQKAKKPVKSSRNEKEAPLLRTAVECGAAGLLVTLLLLLAVSAGMVSGAVAQGMADEFIVFCVLIGSVVGGALCAKRRDGGVITAGLCASAVYLAVILAGSMFTVSGVGETTLLIKVIVASLVGGVSGGMICLYKRSKKPKFRKKI